MTSRFHWPLIVVIVVAFLGSIYSVTMVATRLDDYYLPGNELNLGVLGNLPGLSNSQNPEAATIEERINVLLLGLDRRPDDPPDIPTRTDSIAILSLDPYSNTGGVLSIPRDMWVEIPDGYGGYCEQRINAAYSLAEAGYVPYPGGAIALVKDTIERNFGIPIDHYVVLDFVDFIQIIDVLGGIEVEVPDLVYDPQYQECNFCPQEAIVFYPGRQHMDGHAALAYARIRYGSNDISRIERQQQIMRATLRKALRVGILRDVGKLKGLYDQFRKSVETDISLPRALGLALKVQQIPEERIKTMSLAPATYDYVASDGAMVLGWEKEEADRIIRRFFLDGAVEQEAPSIEVLGSTDLPGLADRVALRLLQQGLPEEWVHVSISSFPSSPTSIVYNLRGKDRSARKVAEWIGLSPSQVVSNPPSAPLTSADIVIVVGRDLRRLSSNFP